ncbi:protein-L-isoaspartate O-methyltransferase family protein [Pseudemcibacter aquimaris]|uniref:protein-L-isoaspartate O-methyltransferase family protein n=1 Tax=Pseudemcibacter aquimaris TaxID=2857064 RepID=UPI002011758F|nr:protein-L-isoaspartate O-methyltransferase [Pseudemcibacter aquimaris]MCC3859796.1 protein-L-isoaspartate O-methyltransferase [Pseudemcibacter aquimaris]WDU60190.1 protein-L-isoaspartate O-methyltransferase [Pseudemcibacter aquimaris]
MSITSKALNPDAKNQHMIDGQLLPNDVTDENVVEAISKVNRESFVPAERKGVAYIDKSIKVAENRYMLEPLALAKLLSYADIQSDELVLDIAPSTGYSSAVLSKLVDAVVAIEENKELSEIATKNLADEECDNVAVINSVHNEGLAKQGPYDLILINGMVDDIPKALLEQLNDGGRILCVLNQDGYGRASLVTYNEGIMGVRILFDAIAHKLEGFVKEEKFVF